MPRPLDLPPPRNWQDFEDLCLDLWRRLWKDPDAQKHGRQGQPQAGVDVYGRDGGQWIGVQCKRLEGDLTPKVIEEEVEKARTFEPPLSRFVLATTARSDIDCQKAAREITESGFPVTVVSWDEICHHLEDHPDLLRKYFSALIDPPPTGYRCMAVPPEKGFVEREELEEIRAILCGDGSSAVGITSALRGAGGFGKTTLAQALCQDARVRAAYPDGILWTTIGDQATPADRLSRVLDLIRWWRPGEAPHFDTVEVAAARLREILAGRRALVVVDDAWTAADVEPFRGAGAGLLVTSRHHEALDDCVCIDVDAMRLGEAVKLLMADLPGAEGLRPRFEDLARTLGEWPLLLKLVNGTLLRWVQRGLGIEKALEEVAQAGLESFDRRDSTAREKAVSRTMEVSLRHLSEEGRRRYEALAIFPEDENVPLRILERLWSCPAFDVRDLSLLLHGLSLLRDLDLGTGTLRLHDVFRKYLIGRQGDAITALHLDFLARSLPVTGRWADLPSSESYLWRWLPYHLVSGGQSEILKDLLIDFHFLAAKLRATDVNAIIAGFDLLPGVPDLHTMQSAIRLSAHILVHHPEQFAGQLLGRLPEKGEDGELRGWEGLRRESGGTGRDRLLLSGAAALLPRRASLTLAGGPLLRTFAGHPSGVIALSAIGKGQAMSGLGNGMLCLWDLTKGSLLRTFPGHTGQINAVAAVGEWGVLSGSSDGTLRLWDLATSACLRIFARVTGRITAVVGVGEERALSASDEAKLRLWDLTTGNCLRVFESDWVNAVAVVGEKWAISTSFDGMRLWDLATGDCLRHFATNALAHAVAAVGERGALLGLSDGALRLYDLTTGAYVRNFQGHTDRINTVAVIGEGQALSGSDDGTLRLWDLATGACLSTLEGHTDKVNALVPMGEGQALSGSDDGTLRLWDLSRGVFLRTFERHTGRVSAVAAVGKGRVLSASDDGKLRLWDLATGASLRIMRTNKRVSTVTAVGKCWALSASNDGKLRLWDLITGAFLHTFEKQVGRVSAITAVGNERALSASENGLLHLWDLATGSCLHTIALNAARISALAAVGEGVALVASSDGKLGLWDLATGFYLSRLEGYTGRIRALVALGERRALLGSSDGTVYLWDLATGACLRTFLEGRAGGVYAVTAVGGDWALAGSSNGTLRLWNLTTGACMAVFTFDHPVLAVAVSNDIVIVGDSGGNVHFLDLILPDSP